MRTVKEVEEALGWTEEDASMCGCYSRPEPCSNCWSLGWQLGGLEVSTATGEGLDVIAALPQRS